MTDTHDEDQYLDHDRADCLYMLGCSGCAPKPNPGPEPVDDEDAPDPAVVMQAITDGHRKALNAAEYWRDIAATLTDLRKTESGWQPELPLNAEEWSLTRRPEMPFDLEEMQAELHALSGLITKAHTIATLYRERAEELEEEVDSLKAAEVAARERSQYTPEQIAAAERVTHAHALVADHLNNEPSDDGENWRAWNDGFQAAETRRLQADRAYADLFDGRVPDAREVLGR